MTLREELALSAAPESVGLGRHFLRRTLKRWHLPDDTIDSATLLVSEALTNAVVHACPPVSLVVRSDGDLLVEVHDGDPTPALTSVESAGLESLIHNPDLEAENGRGLAMIAMLASRWGITAERDGKTVWFALELPRMA
jgi:anti-sigma regulatory factor (Ser/Thr protein kinase)